MSGPSYPKSFELPSNAEKQGQGVRNLNASVIKALQNPVLPSIMNGQNEWGDIPTGKGPGTEAGDSQTTTNNTHPTVAPDAGGRNVDDADSRVHNPLSEPEARTVGNDVASQVQTASYHAMIATQDGMSISNVDAQHHDINEEQSPYSPANASHIEFEVSNMGPWADKEIDKLEK